MKLFEPPQSEGWKILICVTHTYAIFVISSPEFPVISRSTLSTCAYKNVEIGLSPEKHINDSTDESTKSVHAAQR